MSLLNKEAVQTTLFFTSYIDGPLLYAVCFSSATVEFGGVL